MTVHGGDVWEVAEHEGIDAEELLDFSANINPRGLPPRAQQRLSRDASHPRPLSFYPDPEARRLRKALSKHLDVPPESIVVGAGAESLLTPVLRCLQPRRALVPIPAFSEYRRVCERERIEFIPFPLNRAELFRIDVTRLPSSDLIVLNNPHNPTGALLDPQQTLRMFDATLLLDEAFIDYVPQASLARVAAYQPRLIVLRSLTKFYGCPALRVGYAVAHPDNIERIRSFLPTWPVTQLASDALTEAVGDCEYAEASIPENAREREALANSMSNLGLFVFPSAANYLFVELNANMPTAAELRSRLIAKHRILIRNCDSYEGLAPGRYIRVAVRSGAENGRLTEAIAEELNS